MIGKRFRRRDPEIAPDEIFLVDAVGDFDRSRFEGRLERPLTPGLFQGFSLLLAALFLIIVLRTGHLEILEGGALAAASAHNALSQDILFAPRGLIYDYRGEIMVDNALDEEGVMRRVYRYPELGQIIGYVSYPKKDKNGYYYETRVRGVAGLEAQYDEALEGENGQILTETDAFGNIRSQGTIVPAQSGEALTLTIDAQMEQELARAIRDVAVAKGFSAGAGVILDVRTGAVRAIVSYPSYDPTVMSEGTPEETIARYHTDPGYPFLDHVVQGIYTPGSIVKPFIAAGALSDGLITPETIINDPGSISLPDPYNPGKRYVFTGWRPLGLMDVRKAIAWSSDIYFYTVGGGFGSQKGLGIDRLTHWYKTFGLGAPTGIDLPEEVGGVLPTPEWKKRTFNESWYTGDTYFTSIGQYGMQVTPLQMARATAALANGGRLLRPYLVEGAALSETRVPISEEVLRVVREGMRLTVTGALAQRLNLPYVTVAAKTGTAQTGTRNQYDNSWVEGFYPYENPEYAFAVVLERGPAGTGSQAVNAMADYFAAMRARELAAITQP